MVQSFNTTGNLFEMTKCKNTLNVCLFYFLFVSLVGWLWFFFVQSHVLEHTVEEWWCHWRVHTNRQLHTWNRQEGREAGRRIFSGLWVFFCCLCFVFFHGLLITPVRWKRSFHTGISSDMFRFRTSQNSFNSFVTSRSHFTSSQTRYWPLLFNWICSKRI